jgi:hypothetical protein
VVLLAAGTYSLNAGLNIPSNVTLRGLGANQTILNFTALNTFYWGSFAIGFIGNYNTAGDGQPGGVSGSTAAQRRSWTGTNGAAGVYTKGATVLNLASAPTGLSVGDMLQLWQNTDPAGNVPRNTYFVSSKTGTGTSGITLEGPGIGNGNQEQHQLVKVVSIAGSDVTITPGLHSSYWQTANSPFVNWEGGDLRMAGVESLSVDTTSAPTHWGSVTFYEAADCWAKGVRLTPKTGAAGSANQARAGFFLFYARNLSIVDSLITRMVGGGASSTTSYGLEINYVSSSLIQNNILLNIESPIFDNQGNAGNVFAYNYEVRPDGTISQTGLGGHDGGTLMGLWEGNNINGYRIDSYHGTQGFQTVFRNRLRGDSGGVLPYDTWGYSRNHHAIGNVLGTSGQQGTYTCDGNTAAACDRYAVPGAVFRLGYPKESPALNDTGVQYDSFAGATLMRWGNWDIVNNAVRWVSGEVPTGAEFPNAVPGNQTLPASFYLSAKPNWWPSGKAWPPIGPDVTGGNISGVGGFAYTIPSQDCYTSLGGTLTNFNSFTCYGV